MKIPENAISEIRRAIEAVHANPGLHRQGDALQVLTRALQQAISAQQPGSGVSAHAEDHELSLVLSAMSHHETANKDKLDDGVLSDGELLGTVKYEDLDVGWAEALARRMFARRVPFPSHKGAFEPVRIPNQTRLALVGDWGTGNESSLEIARRVREGSPDYTIHLGDVYYAGTPKEEKERFVDPWPPGARGSFALNSNHEMYSGGQGYFGVALHDAKFSLQGGLSYFALENDHWIFVGLDSAYYSGDFLYQAGQLDEGQLRLLGELGARARAEGKGLVVLSHHQGISEGGEVETLWKQVTNVLIAGPERYYWYWGHIHAAMVLAEREAGKQRVLGRCIGHGGVPFAPPRMLQGRPDWLAWYENELAQDPQEPRRALNGFALLELDGPRLSEQLISEKGQVRWSSEPH